MDIAGGFGEVPSLGGGADLDLRQASVAGEVVDKLVPTQPAVVLADLHANARAMIAAVMMSRGVIGVSHNGVVAALRLQFLDDRAPRPNEHWADLRVGAELEFRPQDGGTTITVADVAALQAAYKAAHLEPYRVVDVLVAPNVDAQHLVDVLVSLEHAGARAIGLGELPSSQKCVLAD